MRIYSSLSKIGFLKRYSYKFLFVAFLGIHVPLIGVITLLLVRDGEPWSPAFLFWLTLALTLVATGATLWVQYHLTAPIRQVSSALRAYASSRTRPTLPTHHTDEAGELMANVQETIGQLDALLREKEDLIGLITHDVRGPLASAIELLDIMQEETDPTELAQCFQLLRGSLQNQYDLVKTMLQALHVESNALQKQPVELQRLIDHVFQEVRPVAAPKQVTLKVSHYENHRLMLHREMFCELLKNLLINAIKFSNPQDVVYLNIHHDPDEFRLEVIDAGIGFDPTAAERIFERFTRERQVGTAGEQSTGLGLYLCRKIVALHNGTLTAYSDGPNQGATFTILLPTTSLTTTETHAYGHTSDPSA